MAQYLTLFCLTVLIYTAAGQSASTVLPSMTSSISTSLVPTATPTTNPPTTPPPTEPQPPTPPDDYMVRNSDGTVCVHMKAGLAIIASYTGISKHFDFMKDTTTTAGSTCDSVNGTAMLKLNSLTPHRAPMSVIFNIDKVDNRFWNVSSIKIGLTFNRADYPGYTGAGFGNVSSTSAGPLFNNGNVSLNSSFSCNNNRTISGFSSIHSNISVSLLAFNLQLQAFGFQNSTSGAFDQSTPCLEDNMGNKIVPIAVGAALAGLVIVVLVAYLIGRLRNRKKSSYEALPN